VILTLIAPAAAPGKRPASRGGLFAEVQVIINGGIEAIRV
jgi:hypothetical protein